MGIGLDPIIHSPIGILYKSFIIARCYGDAPASLLRDLHVFPGHPGSEVDAEDDPVCDGDMPDFIETDSDVERASHHNAQVVLIDLISAREDRKEDPSDEKSLDK